MSFFTTPVKELEYRHLAELVQDRAQENVRLEYKSQFVDRDECLKKVTSFANSFGGWLIFGIQADKESRAVAVGGVDAVNNIEQKITSWCLEFVHETLLPEISNSIAIPGSSKVAYVVKTEESGLAPHFIEGRGGCYIRANEQSHRYEAQLAETKEIQALLNRREEARNRAVMLLDRSRKRLAKKQQLVSHAYKLAPTVPLTIRVEPAYPIRQFIQLVKLPGVAKGTGVRWQSRVFPDESGGVSAQADSLIYLGPSNRLLSYLELTTYGTVSYTEFLQPESISSARDRHVTLPQEFTEQCDSYIESSRVLAAMYLTLAYAAKYIQAGGVYGSLRITISLSNLPAVAFFTTPGNRDEALGQAFSYLDDETGLEKVVRRDDLIARWEAIADELWPELCFGLGWAESMQPSTLHEHRAIKTHAYRRLNWELSS